jgi:hypothetical protein
MLRDLLQIARCLLRFVLICLAGLGTVTAVLMVWEVMRAH